MENNDNENKFRLVPSKNKKIGKKIVLKVDMRDLPDKINKEDVVAAIKTNTEEQQRKSQEPSQQESSEKEQKKSKFKAKYVIPILAPLVLIGGLKACQNQDKPINIPTTPTPIIQQEDIQQSNQKIQLVEEINGQYYEIDSPYVYMGAVTNAAGQEGMTANVLDGNMAMTGKHYDSTTQFQNENRSSVGQEEFAQMKAEIDECMKKLSNPTISREEKSEVANKALELNNKIGQIYTTNLEYVESQSKQFAESSEAYKDSNTDAEIGVIQATVANYKENLELTELNGALLSQIVQLADSGYTIDIEVEENSRGDYTISGKALKELAEEVGMEEQNYSRFVESEGKSYIEER